MEKKVLKSAKMEMSMINQNEASMINEGPNTDMSQLEKEIKENFNKEMDNFSINDENAEAEITEIVKWSEEELIRTAASFNLENDPQTRKFCQFLAAANNFASSKLIDKFKATQELSEKTSILQQDMVKEIKKDYHSIATEFDNIKLSFKKLVQETQYNMQMLSNFLEYNMPHMQILADKLDSREFLEDEKKDLNNAVSSIGNKLKEFIDFHEKANQESNKIEKKLNLFKNNVKEKVIVNENRLDFSQVIGKSAGAGAASSIFTGYAVSAAYKNESALFGGVGTLTLGGITFNALGTLILGIAVGGFVYMICNFSSNQNKKTLEYLNEILENIKKLQDESYKSYEILENIKKLQNQSYKSLISKCTNKSKIDINSLTDLVLTFIKDWLIGFIGTP